MPAFARPLLPARLVRRYKRFLCDALLPDGRQVTAHCPNPGAMAGLLAPEGEIWLEPVAGKNRKLPYSWELVRVGAALVGVNAARANRIVEAALAAAHIPALAGYPNRRREVPFGQRSRVDFLLSAPDRPPCLVEVKNVHWRRDDMRNGLACFPDCVTRRGARHLDELAGMVKNGMRAVMLYVVQRDDCTCFGLAGDIDPGYAAAAAHARAAGVEMLCHACRVDPDGVEMADPLPILPHPPCPHPP